MDTNLLISLSFLSENFFVLHFIQQVGGRRTRGPQTPKGPETSVLNSVSIDVIIESTVQLSGNVLYHSVIKASTVGP